ncbi:hypothetical protein [Acinetobacter pollinis]|uniref:hypothetical protein n=1 Tax=Acinetobacter pollinis TaxID=2605270 RepID=UPI0018A2C842|nr:hypothetical protein [Acinetobacter pollinis]MBF7690861.1 hypothetical protein [Acinetobacter pollinis]MBF7698506.1 hypothetical protein [Acinetobacter pollinis]
MTTIFEAFSKDLGCSVTVPEAEKFFDKKQIKSKYEFQCIGENCSANITCANLDKPKDKRIVPPYFKYVSEHAENCSEGKRIKILEIEFEKRKKKRDLSHLKEGDVMLDLTPYSDTKKTTSHTSSTGGLDSKETGETNENDSTSNSNRRPMRLRLSGLVDKFEERINLTFVDDSNNRSSLNDLFINFETEQNIEDLPDEPKIYYGKAWINPARGGYSIKFIQKMRYKEELLFVSFYISEYKLKDLSKNSRFSSTKFDAFIERKKPLKVYIYSELPPDLKNEKYLNFYLKDLSYLVYTDN